MSTLDSNTGEKGSSESISNQAKQLDLHFNPPQQSFRVREGDRIVIDKRKFHPVFTRYKNRTIITIKAK